MEIRAYRGGDEIGIVSVWNEALSFDPIHMGVFVKSVLCDVNFDPEGMLVAESDGRIVGFCLAIARRLPMKGTDLEPETGWITVLGVDPAYRRRGIGGSLVEAAEAYLRRLGRKNVLISPYAPNYFWPGVDRTSYPDGYALFESAGYRTLYSPIAMDRNLVDFSTPEDVRRVEADRIAEGYVFEALTPGRIYELIAFADERFSPDWGRAVREAVIQGVPADQMQIAIDPAGNIAGFALFGCYGGVQERFGPFGVDEKERGKGLGKVLLYRTMERMKSKGLHGAWFLWTSETSAAGRLYARAGFHISRTFCVMKKVIEA